MAINLELTSDDFASLYHRSFVDPAKKKTCQRKHTGNTGNVDQDRSIFSLK